MNSDRTPTHREPATDPSGRPTEHPASSMPPTQSEPAAMPATPARNPGDEADPGSPGVGEDTCQRCSGTGLLDDGAPCPDCGGSGIIIQGIGGG